jgi:hypothetical protein
MATVPGPGDHWNGVTRPAVAALVTKGRKVAP